VIFIETLINGKIEGIIKIVKTEKDFKNIKNKVIVIKEIPLEILPKLYQVKGIIVEKGSKLSHITIFLREIGIPMIKINDALKKYKDNEKIII
jgi:phosphohistidine swiveling domain-containing protein